MAPEAYSDPRKYRFVVSKNLLPGHKKQGYRAEIVDSTHPSDGGPVAIKWFTSEAKARTVAAKLNNEGEYYACSACGSDTYKCQDCIKCDGTGLMTEQEAKDFYFADA